MMKSTELRIGNIVSYFNDRIKVTQILPLWIESDYSPYGYIEYDKLEPILLTEEVLLKFGFFKGEKYFSFKGFDVDSKGWIGFGRMTADCKIRYAHQLQNLYFALSGNELHYKP